MPEALGVVAVLEEQTPHAILAALQTIGGAVPTVEVADERQTLRARSPLPIPQARLTFVLAAIEAEVLVPPGKLKQ